MFLSGEAHEMRKITVVSMGDSCLRSFGSLCVILVRQQRCYNMLISSCSSGLSMEGLEIVITVSNTGTHCVTHCLISKRSYPAHWAVLPMFYLPLSNHVLYYTKLNHLSRVSSQLK